MDSGELTWRPRPDHHFADERAARAWNKRYAYKTAGSVNRQNGYRRIVLNNKGHQAHRVIYAMMNGEWPENEIDHINGKRDDNRWCNLRDVCRYEQTRNASIRSDNDSGITGVHYREDRQRWVAYIHSDEGDRLHLGNYETKPEAVAARLAAQKLLDYHENH
ncbi:MAG: HNH endonuclease signature motif containing protein, partial [Cyanobacteria bacterium J06555_12]